MQVKAACDIPALLVLTPFCLLPSKCLFFISAIFKAPTLDFSLFFIWRGWFSPPRPDLPFTLTRL